MRARFARTNPALDLECAGRVAFVELKGSRVTTKPIYEIGELPPLGVVPERMHAAVIRQERYA